MKENLQNQHKIDVNGWKFNQINFVRMKLVMMRLAQSFRGISLNELQLYLWSFVDKSISDK